VLDYCTLLANRLTTALYSVLARDAMLARYVLSLCVRLSVRPSHAGIAPKRRITEITPYDSPGFYCSKFTRLVEQLHPVVYDLAYKKWGETWGMTASRLGAMPPTSP